MTLSLKITGKGEASIPSYQVAGKIVRQLAEREGFGARDMPACKIYETDANGKKRQVAFVSFNGAVWSGTKFRPGMEALS